MVETRGTEERRLCCGEQHAGAGRRAGVGRQLHLAWEAVGRVLWVVSLLLLCPPQDLCPQLPGPSSHHAIKLSVLSLLFQNSNPLKANAPHSYCKAHSAPSTEPGLLWINSLRPHCDPLGQWWDIPIFQMKEPNRGDVYPSTGKAGSFEYLWFCGRVSKQCSTWVI